MRNKVLAIFGLVGFCLLLSGCSSVQGYSVRSYQGPLPMNDYQYLNQSSGSSASGGTVANR